MATELKIDDGYLRKCVTDNDTVTIPAEVRCVDRDAFASCPNVKVVNLHPEYVKCKISEWLGRCFKRMIRGWRWDYYAPAITVYDIDSAVVDEAIAQVATEAQKTYEGPIHTLAIDADQLLRCDVGAFIESMPTDGLGLLHIRNVNKENNKELMHQNFSYNLFRSHSLLRRPLPRNWMVVIDTSARLDDSDCYSAFSQANCKMASVDDYLLYWEKIYLDDSASEEFQYIIPFVVTDPGHLVEISEYIPYPFTDIDLATVKAGDFKKFVADIHRNPVVVFRNIDKIAGRKERDDWQALVVCGLKGEKKTFFVDDDMNDMVVHFDKIKTMCTCSEYPEWLRSRGNLGIGPNFTRFYKLTEKEKDMALWSPTINRARRLAEAEKKNSEEPVEAVKPAEEINEKEIDWEERRFQVVLSLLAHDGAPGGLWTFNERAKLVFQKADMVIGAYKKFCEKMK